jgi:hypothetical protein
VGSRKAREEARRIGKSQTCSTGKMIFPSKAAAREYMRQRHFKGMRPYPCPECSEIHVGHIPWQVRQGLLTANEWYGTAELDDDDQQDEQAV